MWNYPIHITQQHLFITIANLDWLIDTGTPQSFGNRSLTIADTHHNIAQAYFGIDAEELTIMVNHSCVGIIGNDILQHYDVVFDIPSNTMQLYDHPQPHSTTTIPMQLVMNVPLIEITHSNDSIDVLFDSGAQLSYLPAEICHQYLFSHSQQDFYPMIGQFDTDVYHVPITVAGITQIILCGILPDMLAFALQLTGASGILGNQLMHLQRVHYSLAQKQLSFEGK